MSSATKVSFNSVCLGMLTVGAITVALIYFQSILIPFAVSLFLYCLINPITDYLHKGHNLPKILSTLITILIAIVVVSILGLGFFVSIKSFVADAGQYNQKILKFVDELGSYLSSNGIEVSRDTILSTTSISKVFSQIKGLTEGVASFAGNSLLVFVIVLFLVDSSEKPKKKLEKIVNIKHKINQYVYKKFIVSVLTGLAVFIILSIIGVQMAGMFGLLTLLLNFIPSVGSLISVLLPLPIVLLQFGFGLEFASATVLPALVQFAVGNVIEPKMMGSILGLHPVTQIFALLFWGAVWGIAGMFLAVPLVVIVKLILEQYPQTLRLARLLEGNIS